MSKYLTMAKIAQEAEVGRVTPWRWTQYGYNGKKLAYIKYGRTIKVLPEVWNEFKRWMNGL